MAINALAIMHAIAQHRRAGATPITPHTPMNLGGMQQDTGAAFSPIAPASVLARPGVGGNPQDPGVSPAPSIPNASPISPTIRPGRQASLPPQPDAPLARSAPQAATALPESPVSSFAEPTGQLGDRFQGVQEAIKSGDFDPSGMNYTTFGPGMEGRGNTPAMRFMDAAVKDAGVDLNSVSPQTADTLKGITDTTKINSENWDKFITGSPASANIEDRRGEGFMWWGNKSMGDWTPEDWQDYNKARKEHGGSENNIPMMGDVIPMSETFRSLQRSNAETRSLSRPTQGEQPKAPVLPIKPLGEK